MKFDVILYGITDSSYKTLPIEEQVLSAIKGGASIIQLREKNIPGDEYIGKARKVLRVTRKYGVPLIINDSIETALKAGADGVHLGQSDGSPEMARAILGNDAIIGVTAKTVSQARTAALQGADYLGCGAVFKSPTKPSAIALTREELTAICGAVSIPVCAIGGITAENLPSLKGCGISGAAAVSSLFESESPEGIETAARKLRNAAEEAVYG